MTRALHAKQVKVSLVVASAVMLVAGCGTHPGAAVVVGDTSISNQEVNDAAAALCASTISSAEAQGQPRPELAARGARQAAVQLMLDSELTRQFGEAEGIEPSQGDVSAALAQNAQGIDAIPAEQRDDFRALFRGFQESQLIIEEAGRASLTSQGNAEPTPEEVTAEGTRLRNRFASDLDVEVDPRFGELANGTVTPTSGSLSIPVSERAAQGAAAEPGPEWTSGLPASQKC
ncbi:MAG TPA: SurA N-terminal domain-containing protein [Nocardioides sp.]|uniref:SurA N-terminal domain-containing protein n=1 Tax=Nocardioides sp. TaxID=35761 RepID=UPI002D7F1EE1|nr:SurA N-terminal domain-containing protein [Nocardioides sp.]HET6652347.1 SurA N-terminal domain-containing protein [Nocardioides sp.]